MPEVDDGQIAATGGMLRKGWGYFGWACLARASAAL